jgi:hypothetical protein
MSVIESTRASQSTNSTPRGCVPQFHNLCVSPALYGIPNFRCSAQERPPLKSVLSQLNLHHTITRCLFNIHFNIILSSVFRSPSWSLFFSLSY